MQLPKIKRINTSSGLVKFQVRYRENGRGSKYRNLRFDSRQEAQEFIVKMMNKRRAANGLTYLAVTTFRVETDFWLATRGKSVSPSHLIKVKGIFYEILPMYGKFKPEKFNHGLLSEFQATQLEGGLSNATVNHKVQAIKAVLRHSHRTKRIAENPSSGFGMLKTQRNNIDFWERWEAEAFLAYANQKYPKGSPNRWVYGVYLLALNTGVRSGEIWGLQPQNIRSNGRVLYIDRQFDRSIAAMRPTKGKEPRNVPCNIHLHDTLKEIFETLRVTPLFNTIFCHPESGEAVCHEVFRRQFFVKDLKESGVRDIRFHDMRHTAATLMIDRGIDLVTVSRILGHKDMKTTMLYLHLLPTKIEETGAIFNVGPTSVTMPQPFPKLALI